MIQIAKKPNKKSIIQFRNKAISKASKLSYRASVEQFNKYLTKTKQQEGKNAVKSFLKEIRKTKSPATFNLRMQGLKEYLTEKYKDDYPQLFGIDQTFKSIKRLKVEKAVLKDDYLTFDQVQELAEKFSIKISLLIQALFWTGARVSELINIKIENIQINGKAIIKIMGKCSKERTVYLPLPLYTVIRGVFRGKVYLFETSSGKKYHPVNVHREVKRQGNDHGYSIHPHTFRHSKAMYLKNEKKLSPDQIAKALGHSSVVTTLESYFHGTPSAKDQGIEDVDIET